MSDSWVCVSSELWSWFIFIIHQWRKIASWRPSCSFSRWRSLRPLSLSRRTMRLRRLLRLLHHRSTHRCPVFLLPLWSPSLFLLSWNIEFRCVEDCVRRFRIPWDSFIRCISFINEFIVIAALVLIYSNVLICYSLSGSLFLPRQLLWLIKYPLSVSAIDSKNMNDLFLMILPQFLAVDSFITSRTRQNKN